jgi:hypothetical protein
LGGRIPNKYGNGRDGRVYPSHTQNPPNGVTYSYAFFDEFADVLICLEQLEVALKDFPDGQGRSLWDDVIEKKERN